jgi:uncharacterized HAD superfamily protein
MIGIDLDGVIADTPDLIEQELITRGYDVVSFNKYNPDIRGIDDNKKIINDIVHDILTERNFDIKPYTPFINTILAEINFVADITIVTARRKEYNKETRAWLDHYMSEIPLNIVNVSSNNKTQYIKNNNMVCLVEDRLRTANHAAAEGVNTYLINRKWNMGRPTHDDVVRIGDLSTFQSLLASHCRFTSDGAYDIVVKEHVKNEKDLLC